jgi:hypothetical protein
MCVGNIGNLRTTQEETPGSVVMWKSIGTPYGQMPANRVIDRDAGERCALPGARHRGR